MYAVADELKLIIMSARAGGVGVGGSEGGGGGAGGVGEEGGGLRQQSRVAKLCRCQQSLGKTNKYYPWNN